jgi:hypothetical protein
MYKYHDGCGGRVDTSRRCYQCPDICRNTGEPVEDEDCEKCSSSYDLHVDNMVDARAEREMEG